MWWAVAGCVFPVDVGEDRCGEVRIVEVMSAGEFWTPPDRDDHLDYVELEGFAHGPVPLGDVTLALAGASLREEIAHPLVLAEQTELAEHERVWVVASTYLRPPADVGGQPTVLLDMNNDGSALDLFVDAQFCQRVPIPDQHADFSWSAQQGDGADDPVWCYTTPTPGAPNACCFTEDACSS